MRPAWLDLNADETAEDLALPAEVRVKQGMALLDEKHGPGWVRRIDVDTLDLAHVCRCVLGQLYRHDPEDENAYDRGARAMFGSGAGSFCGTLPAEAAHGFLRTESADYGGECQWSDLTTAWKHAILARRMEATT